MPQQKMRQLSWAIDSSKNKLLELQATKTDILAQIRKAVQHNDTELKEIKEKQFAYKAHLKNMAALETHHDQNEQQITQCTQQIQRFEAQLHALQKQHLPEPGLYTGTHGPAFKTQNEHSRDGTVPFPKQPYVSHAPNQATPQRKMQYFTTTTKSKQGLYAHRNEPEHKTETEPQAWNPFGELWGAVHAITNNKGRMLF